MKLKDVPSWNKLIFSDRTILRKDLNLMAKFQIEALMELEIESTNHKNTYKVKPEE